MLRTIFTSLALLTCTALAQTAQTAIITITASHGGAGNGLTNQTITVPLNHPFTNSSALAAVSYLYLTGGTGVPYNSITCQAYQDAAATESGGNPFNSTTPALLSTNTVQVGSILCTSTYVALRPPGGDFSTSILATPTSSGGSNLSTAASTSSTSTSAMSSSAMSSSATSSPTRTGHTGGNAGPVTSLYVTTMSATGGQPASQSTVTSIYVPNQSTMTANPTDETGNQGGQQTGSATASASAQLSSQNAGTAQEFGAQLYAGLAVAWMGLAYVL